MSDLKIVSLHILLFCNYYILFKRRSFVVFGELTIGWTTFIDSERAALSGYGSPA